MVASVGIHGQAHGVRTSILSTLLAVVTLTGCYATHEPGGGPTRRDAGPIDTGLRDGGPPVFPVDGGPPIVRDAGPVDCRTEVVEPWAGDVACSESVNDCMRSCASGGAEGCFEECIAAEPECQRCFYQTLIACSNREGCAGEWRRFACCTEGTGFCAGLTGFERLQCAGECPAEIEEYSSCLNTSAEMCFFEAAGNCNLRIGG